MQALSEFRAQPKTHRNANLVSNDRFACSVLRGERYMQALSEFRAQTLHANLTRQDRSACSVLRGERYMQALSEFRAQFKNNFMQT